MRVLLTVLTLGCEILGVGVVELSGVGQLGLTPGHGLVHQHTKYHLVIKTREAICEVKSCFCTCRHSGYFVFIQYFVPGRENKIYKDDEVEKQNAAQS